MKKKWVKKGYWGSGSYHGDFTCQNLECSTEKTPPKSKMWFVMWEPEAFENRFPVIHGYCSKKCAEEAEKGMKLEHEECLVNPYILTGEELERAEHARKRGEHE